MWKRPVELESITYQFVLGERHLYVTVGFEGKEIKEVFIDYGKGGTWDDNLTEALGRVISIALQNKIHPYEISTQLKDIKNGSIFPQKDGTKVFSLPDAVAVAIEKTVEFLEGKE